MDLRCHLYNPSSENRLEDQSTVSVEDVASLSAADSGEVATSVGNQYYTCRTPKTIQNMEPGRRPQGCWTCKREYSDGGPAILLRFVVNRSSKSVRSDVIGDFLHATIAYAQGGNV